MRNRVANNFRPTELMPFFCRVATYLGQPSTVTEAASAAKLNLKNNFIYVYVYI